MEGDGVWREEIDSKIFFSNMGRGLKVFQAGKYIGVGIFYQQLNLCIKSIENKAEFLTLRPNKSLATIYSYP